MLGLTQLSNYLTLKGPFSAVSKPNFASKYALESSRRDLHNALLCTVLNAQNFRQKSLKILLIFSPNFAKFDKFSLDFGQIMLVILQEFCSEAGILLTKPEFCRIFPIRPRRNVQGTRRLPRRLPHRVPAVCIFAEIAPYRASQN